MVSVLGTALHFSSISANSRSISPLSGDGVLGRAGMKVIGGTDLFGLFEARDGVDVLDHFARAAILVRGFAAAPQLYRFGLPADEAAWQRLEAACATLK